MKDVHVYWVVFSSDARREKEALKSANDFLKSLKKKKIVIKRFRNSFFPYCGAEIKEYFEQLSKEFSPDIIFTHFRNDLHQDHRLISELTWNTYRNHLILEYEIPKYDGDLGSPNFFVQFDETIRLEKIGKIMKYFKSQGDKAWFTRDTFSSILRLRGMESNAPGKFAEGFYCRKISL
jgi:LmbE family N-acetylglucosaminyl deacetylase